MDAEIVNSLVLGDIGFEKPIYFEFKTLFLYTSSRHFYLFGVVNEISRNFVENYNKTGKNGMNSMPILIF